jgi:4,5-DOPA dioxygenase extradiol
MTLPVVFVSHGSPSLILDGGPTVEFLRELGRQLPRPRAIACVSAHWDTSVPAVTAGRRPPTIHDFGGFPAELYRQQYPAPGAPVVAERILGLLQGAGLPAAVSLERGLDHGAWVPLKLMYPEADVAVTQVSIQSRLRPGHHVTLGRVLAPLAGEDVLILASGAATHNLYEFGRYPVDAQPPRYVTEFVEWLTRHVLAGDADAVADFRRIGPNGERNHPGDDHFMPLLVAMGAGAGRRARVLHDAYTYGILGMTAYAFE